MDLTLAAAVGEGAPPTTTKLAVTAWCAGSVAAMLTMPFEFRAYLPVVSTALILYRPGLIYRANDPQLCCVSAPSPPFT